MNNVFLQKFLILEYLLITFYLVLLSVVILKTRLFRSKHLSKSFILGVFYLKVVFSFLYGFLAWKNGWGDTFGFFRASKTMAEFWPHHPLKFLRLLFGPDFTTLPPAYQEVINQKSIGYYGLMRSGFILKVNALFQVFSFGYYSVHCIFFAFLSLIGIFFIYDFVSTFCSRNRFLLKLFIYFTPSLLYWLSGAHKDALIIFGFGMIFTTYKQFISKKQFLLLLPLLIACVFTYNTRDYAFLLFVPAFLSYIFASNTRINPFLPFLAVYLFSVIFFFKGEAIHPAFNFPERFIAVQQHFLGLDGATNFDPVLLEPNFQSFLKAIPVALKNSFLQPGLTFNEGLLYKLSFFENIILIALSLFAIVFSNFKKLNNGQKSIALFCFSFALSYYLLLGLTVSNIGAIVRYKATGLVFMGIGLIAITDSNKFPKPIQTFIHKLNNNYGS